MNLNARDLRAVVALMEEKNFTRAAARVHLSQPAFSALIQGMEVALGARLFERSTRSVTLTPEGRLFEPSARRVLADLEGMVADFREHAQRRKGRVAIAALPSLAAGWLPPVLAAFRTRYPGIEIALHDALAQQCKALLRGGQVDFALTTTGEEDADLQSDFLCADEFHLVCRRDHPLATRKRLELAQLAKYPFVHLSRHSSVRQHLEAAFHPVQMDTVLEVEHLATVTGLVIAGMGISVVPELTLFHFRSPELKVRKLRLPGLRRDLHVARRKGEPLSAAAQGLHEMVMHHAPRFRTPGDARA